jgi:hypothetical protein
MRGKAGAAFWATLIATQIMVAPELSAQTRYLGGHAEIGLFPEAGIGHTLTAEAEIRSQVRLGLRWTNPQAFASFYRLHWPSEVDPSFYEIGVRTGLGVADNVAPFIGAGTGLYRRTWHSSRTGGYLEAPERGSSWFVAVMGGFDFVVARPLVFRISAVHHEVLDGDLEALYGRRLRLTGYSAGLGIATW